MIDPVSGYWAKNEDEDEAPDPTGRPGSWIVPSVRITRTRCCPALACRSSSRLTTLATVQHALLRGIEAVFQLEEGEMLAEPMPNATRARLPALRGDRRRRRCADPIRLRTTARLPRWPSSALQIMHFDVERLRVHSRRSLAGRSAGTACVAACYRCLMSYYNQPDHELLDRRDEQARAPAAAGARDSTLAVCSKLASHAASGPSLLPSPDDRSRSHRWLA
jgi:hypothetical protein